MEGDEKMKKKEIRSLFLLVGLVLLFITGCRKKEEVKQVQPLHGEENYQFMTNQMETDDGIYYIEWGHENARNMIYYIDKKMSKKTVLCQKVNCKHDSEKCQAVAKEDEIMGSITCWKGKLYFLVGSSSEKEGNYLKLYALNGDGTGRKLVHTFQYGKIYPNGGGLYGGKLFLSVQTMKELEDGSGETVAEPSVFMYDLETGKETMIIDGVEADGKYTVPCGGSGDSVYLAQMEWDNNNPKSACVYLEYNFKTDEMDTLYETTYANMQGIWDDTLYLQTEGEKKIEKYNLKTKGKEIVFEWEDDVDQVAASKDYIQLIQKEALEEGGFKMHCNWYDLEEEIYLFDDYQDEAEVGIYQKTENGYWARKDEERCFYHPGDKSWEMLKEIK